MGDGAAIERVSPEEEAKLRELAVAVTNDLRLIGLPVEEAGDCWTGSTNLLEGFIVYYDPSARHGEGGVFVRWKPSGELIDAVPKETEPDTRITNMLVDSIDAMTAALQKILEASGWQVRESEWISALKVTR